MRRGDEKAEKGNRDNLGVSLQKKRSRKKRVWKGLWALGNVFIFKNRAEQQRCLAELFVKRETLGIWTVQRESH